VGAPVGRAALAQEANQKAGQKPGAKPRGGTSAPGTRPPPPAPPPVILKRDSGAVPVNSATAVELEALPGIGPALAVRIVAWRTENGPFRDLAALDSVPGIGPALLQRLRPLLRF
jgi:competence protein ComEA